MKKRAIISVSNKDGIVDFARRVAACGYEIVSTGGTADALEAAGVPVTGISDVTKFPECLDGRLKTLHPAVHGGILARRGNPDHMAQIELLDIVPVDILAINLYPFKETIKKDNVSLEEAIENIDIGGPSMLRAGAKNWRDVTVLVDPADYEEAASKLEKGGIDEDMKFRLAGKVFMHTAQYDALIADYLSSLTDGGFPENITLTYEKSLDMRYGENPHQKAAFYREVLNTDGTVAAALKLHGKELSFNNINDASAALMLLSEFKEPCAVAVKHANPCGVGVAHEDREAEKSGKTPIFEAYIRAHDADPVSIYGGIVALNRECDAETAKELSKIFLEIVIAPSFTDEALDIITKKKNIRVLKLDMKKSGKQCPDTKRAEMRGYDVKKVDGGILLQEPDDIAGDDNLKVVTKRAPTQEELDALRFSWRVVKHTRSNAIVLGTNSATVGIGPGQTNRITALELAIKYAGEKTKGCVMASDAFFPFGDCVEAAAIAGITAIIQPGGSVNDEESIKACDKHNIAMVFTGVRHFKH